LLTCFTFVSWYIATSLLCLLVLESLGVFAGKFSSVSCLVRITKYIEQSSLVLKLQN